MSKSVQVECGEVKLKLTLTPKLLEKSLQDAVVAPFLAAYNKRAASPVGEAEPLELLLDGVPLASAAAAAAAALASSASPRLHIHRPLLTPPPPAPEASRPSFARLLALSPSAAEEEWRAALDAFIAYEEAAAAAGDAPAFSSRFGVQPKRQLLSSLLRQLEGEAWAEGTLAACLKALRILSREARHDDELRHAAALLAVARRAALAEDGAAWGEAAAEASVLLHNILSLRGTPAAKQLREQLGAEPRVVALLAEPQLYPLPRLRLYAQTAFFLSLASPSEEALPAFLLAVKAALTWAVGSVSGYTSGADEECLLASALVRTLFNLLRQLQALPVKEASLDEGVAELVVQMINAPDCGEVSTEMKRTSLQLLQVLPKEKAMRTVAPCWPRLIDLLFPLLQGIEKRSVEDTAPLVLLVTLQQICEVDPASAAQVKARLFPAEVYEAMEGKKFDDNKFDPNKPLPADASLRLHVIKLMTSIDYTLKRVVGDFVYAVVGEDPRELIRLCGIGSSAGVLQERGMLAQMQQAQMAGQL